HLGRLAQELEEFDAPQLDVARVELGEGGISELLLDLADVLLDPRCRRQSLLVLQARDRGFVLLVREDDADQAGNEERPGDQRQDQQQVLAEQDAAMRAAHGRGCGVTSRDGGHRVSEGPGAGGAGGNSCAPGRWAVAWRYSVPNALRGRNALDGGASASRHPTEAGARRQWITSSARTSTDCGIESPSSLTVL